MTGIQYLVELAERLKLPLVLCLALGSNQGDHMGYTPLISLYRDWVRFRELSALLQPVMKQERHIIILVMLQDIPSLHLWKFWFPRAVLDSFCRTVGLSRNCSR